jgi:hypothetical protein
MTESVPPDLRDEQQAVEAQIRAAFKGVSRRGGISWYQAVIIDNGEECARRGGVQNKAERRWEDLVDDPDWEHESGIGGFNFLDPIGFAYYIAPAMIRCTREGGGEFVGYALLHRHDLMGQITPVQEHAIARFVRCMIAAHDAQGDEIYGRDWKDAYRNYWAQREQ